MADAILSAVSERIMATLAEQYRNDVYLVRGVDEREVLGLSAELKTIRNVLDDAEKRGFVEETVKNWLKKLDDMSFEMDDVLDEWNYAILKLKMEHQYKQKVCSFIPSSCLRFKKVDVRPDIAKKIQNVKKQLDQILEEKVQYDFVMSEPTTDPSPKSWRVPSTSSIHLAEVRGREPDREILVRKLRPKVGSREELGLHILSIVGVGGIGKTTLAQLVYHDSEIEKCFDLRIWICVSNPFDVVGIAEGIIKSVRNGSCPNTNQFEMLLHSLRDTISGKKFLLVLDDVWAEDDADVTKWEPLKNSLKRGRAGSKILATTRDERVAKMMGTIDDDIHHLQPLCYEDCWKLLRRMARFGRNEEELENFGDIGKKIANKCKGLPLAAKVLGSLLQVKNSLEEWQYVLDSEVWQLEEANVKLFPYLLLSYNDLSPILKHCFSYCAVFPKDSEIEVEKLIENWMALGYLGFDSESGDDMERKGLEYFQNLASLSLFKDFKKSDLDGQIFQCKMHDIVHDFAQHLRKERSNGGVDAEIERTACQSCSSLLVSHVKKYCSLFWEKYCPPNLCNCLTNDSAQHLREERSNGRVDAEIERTACQSCSSSSVPLVKKYCSLFWDNNCPPNLCNCLTSLRVLGITNCKLDSIPLGMENLIHLRWLDMSYTEFSRGDLKTICKLYNLQFLRLKRCKLLEIPMEIGNLIHLRHLDLSFNISIDELPDSICDLKELRSLNVDACSNLRVLPEEINRLASLKNLHNRETCSLKQFPRGLAELNGLRTLNVFRGGSGWSKLGLLENLNQLSGSLTLWIKFTNDCKDMVQDAKEAKLMEKTHIQNLKIIFFDNVDDKESSVRMEVIDNLKPHLNLRNLEIWNFGGSTPPGWIASPLTKINQINQIRYIKLHGFNHMLSLPPLGKLLCLEELEMDDMYGLQYVGHEFLGMTKTTAAAAARDIDIESSSSSSSSCTITGGFPRLKKLTFRHCPKWKVWEDITAEEEESAAVRLMPCLTELTIQFCRGLKELPLRLLRKAPLNVFELYKDVMGTTMAPTANPYPKIR